MNIITKLRKALPAFEWTYDRKFKSYFGSIIMPVQHHRDSKKDKYVLKDLYVFVSGPMYPGTKKDFTYAIAYRKGEHTPYRCRTSCPIEFGKLFVSGKTTEKCVNELIEKFDIAKYSPK